MRADPVIWLLAGPNGAGKSSFYEFHLRPEFPELPFVNADVLAAERWPGEEMAHAYDASAQAMQQRQDLMEQHRSFVTETVFSHPSKLDFIDEAHELGYQVILIYVHVPVEVSLERVAYRVEVDGGHDVPPEKIRARHARLPDLVAQAIRRVDRTELFYNGDPDMRGHRRIGFVEKGRVTWREIPPPDWAQELIKAAGVKPTRRPTLVPDRRTPSNS